MMLMRICALYEQQVGVLAFSTVNVTFATTIVAVGRELFP
jgi:hypothetical protein